MGCATYRPRGVVAQAKPFGKRKIADARQAQADQAR